MKSRLILLFFLLAIALTSMIGLASAQDNGTQLDLDNVDEALGERLNISTFAGGILASIICTSMFVLPTAMYSKKNIIPPLSIGILCLGFSVAVGWLDIWFILVLALLVALMFAGKSRTLIGG